MSYNPLDSNPDQLKRALEILALEQAKACLNDNTNLIFPIQYAVHWLSKAIEVVEGKNIKSVHGTKDRVAEYLNKTNCKK